jgi:hypothetical protein
MGSLCIRRRAQLDDINKLHDEFRNNFIHPDPPGGRRVQDRAHRANQLRPVSDHLVTNAVECLQINLVDAQAAPAHGPLQMTLRDWRRGFALRLWREVVGLKSFALSAKISGNAFCLEFGKAADS